MLLVERGAIGIGGIYQAQGADQGEEAVHSCKYKLRTVQAHANTDFRVMKLVFECPVSNLGMMQA